MVKPLGKDVRCSIARSLEVLGERWTLLIVREAFWGRTRFSQFRDALGVAPDVLADRLSTLVDFGVMERRPYREDGGREREEYVLTEAGEDLRYVLGALNGWGDRHRPAPTGPASSWLEASTGEPVELRFVTVDGRVLELDEVTVVRNSDGAEVLARV
ncbi:MAG: helix-turn-helix domain-containing protein [Propionibacteriaceae bacterium]